MPDLVSTFREVARSHGDATALIDGPDRVSYAALLAKADGFAAECRARRLRRGDRVLLAMPVCADLFAALAGAWSAGLTVVFPEPAMGLSGVRHAIAVTKPRALIATGAYRFLALAFRDLRGKPVLWPAPARRDTAPLPPPDAQTNALISFTSGSTGAPKAIPRSHAFLMAQRDAVAPLLAGEATDLVAFPVFTLVNLAAGRVSVLPDWRLSRPDRVTPEALARRLRETGATRALLPPSLCETLAKSPRPEALHTVFTGGGPVKPALVAALQAHGLRVISVYGSTEAEPIAELDWADVTQQDLDAMQSGAGLLAGHPVDGLALRLRDGEIQVAGDHVNAGYLDPADDAATKLREGGRVWHRTGDAGRMDKDGRLWLLGRSDARVHKGDGDLFPFAVELAAEAWPGVARAAMTARNGAPLLALEGDAEHLPVWQDKAKELGIADIRVLARIPLDRRHRSKVDYGALKKALGT